MCFYWMFSPLKRLDISPCSVKKRSFYVFCDVLHHLFPFSPNLPGGTPLSWSEIRCLPCFIEMHGSPPPAWEVSSTRESSRCVHREQRLVFLGTKGNSGSIDLTHETTPHGRPSNTERAAATFLRKRNFASPAPPDRCWCLRVLRTPPPPPSRDEERPAAPANQYWIMSCYFCGAFYPVLIYPSAGVS